jgi:N-acylneuraminate cytidylyltransferase
MNKTICIIPARKGSKRILGKNKKLFLGKPIIEYIIETCINSNLFDKIIVASDDDEVLKITKKYSIVENFKRNKKNANDLAPLAEILDEVLSSFNNSLLKDVEYACCALPTAVFTTNDDLIRGFKKLKNTDADSVATFLKYSYPVQRSSKLSKDLKVEMLNPEYRWTRTQDLDPVYHDAGQFYWFRTDQGLKGDNKYGVILKNQFAVDIDEPEDWLVAEQLYKITKK